MRAEVLDNALVKANLRDGVERIMRQPVEKFDVSRPIRYAYAL
jgi:hypothetical protein